MKQARYKEPLPLAVIEAARAGDAGAVEQVLQYYNGYINKLCTRTLYDDCGQLHVCKIPFYGKPAGFNKLYDNRQAGNGPLVFDVGKIAPVNIYFLCHADR